MATTIDKSQHETICARYRAGENIPAICADYGHVPSVMIWKILKQGGVEMRPRHSSRIQGQRFNSGVHRLVNDAIRRGELVRQPCEHVISPDGTKCGVTGFLPNGRPAVEAHHDDYNKPYDVRWLCHKHHTQWHETNIAIPPEDAEEWDRMGFLGVPPKKDATNG